MVCFDPVGTGDATAFKPPVRGQRSSLLKGGGELMGVEKIFRNKTYLQRSLGMFLHAFAKNPDLPGSRVYSAALDD